MNAPMKCRTPVFFLNNNGGPECLTDVHVAVNQLSFLPSYLMKPGEELGGYGRAAECEIGTVRVPPDWTFAGWAEVTLHLVNRDELIANKVKALEGDAVRIEAEAHARVTEIRRKINTLLAIDYQPSTNDDTAA